MREVEEADVSEPVAPSQTAYERLNISKLAFRFELDRATVRKRIGDAAIEPFDVKAKEKTYELTPRLAAVLAKIDSPFDEAKLRSVTADAQLREIKVAQAEGQLVPLTEMIDLTQRLFGSMHRELAVRMPKEISRRLAKETTSAAVQKILKAAADRRFKTLRDNWEGMLK